MDAATDYLLGKSILDLLSASMYLMAVSSELKVHTIAVLLMNVSSVETSGTVGRTQP